MKRLIDLGLGLVVAFCISLFIYGFARYPDAPIHACGTEKFCGKQGQLHTKAEFVTFGHWETALLASWPFGVAAAFLLSRRRRSRKIEHRAAELSDDR
jgi:hypothetical protein